MATITKSEVVALTMPRNLDEGLIMDADLTVAKAMYLTNYIVDAVDETGAFYETYVKPVLAFGVIVNIWDRLPLEVTDRGIVYMTSQGAQTTDSDARAAGLRTMQQTLNSLIELMVSEAEDQDMEVYEYEYGSASFVGTDKQGKL